MQKQQEEEGGGPEYLRSVLSRPEAALTLVLALRDMPLDYVAPLCWALYVLGEWVREAATSHTSSTGHAAGRGGKGEEEVD